MKPTLLPIPLALLACGTLALGGCSAFENFGGSKKVSPDEFKIVSHSPLTMPPNAELRPPRPGEPRPQEVTPADQAKEALSPAPVEIDELIRQIGAPTAAVLTVILELELAGRCVRHPGNRVSWS